jgi:predicted nucleic acid-binding protein
MISYYAARSSRDIVIAARQQITQQWWLERSQEFDLYVSTLVLNEIAQGDAAVAARRIALTEGLTVLEADEDAVRLAGLMLQRQVLPEEYVEDALHIAIASCNGMDYLLTWNFSHINNAEKKIQIEAVIVNYGYDCPVFCTPEELMG